jgi:RND superfamily putative drug exporter
MWLGAFVLGGVLTQVIGTGYSTEFSLPDVESRRGFDILDQYFADSGAGGEGGTIVFRATQGVTDPEVQAAMTTLFDGVGRIEGITLVSPYSAEGALQVALQGPEAGRIAYAQIGVPRDITLEEATVIGGQIKALLPHVEGLQVEIGGQIFAEFEVPSSEMLGLAFAIIVLIFAFGSVLAMGLPVAVALAGIGLGSLLAGLLSNVFSIPDFATTIAVMLGLGVGIDYALFIVTRYRENVHHGASAEDATSVAIDTAGRAVAFAGTTVVISLLGMVLMNLTFITGLAVCAVSVVAVTAIAALTLLPALIGFAAHRIEITRWRGLGAALFVAAGLVGVAVSFPALAIVGLSLAAIVIVASFAVAPLRREVPRRAHRPLRETIPYRWSRFVQHRPWTAVLLGTVVMVTLALPFFGLGCLLGRGQLPGGHDDSQGVRPAGGGFGPGSTARHPRRGDRHRPAAAAAVTAALAADPGVAFVSQLSLTIRRRPQPYGGCPTTAPGAATRPYHLRDDVLPAATAGTGLDIAVSGTVAATVDFSEYLTARLPAFIAVVLALSFVLLMLVFRSLLVPLKAVVMNLLSIGAAYGVVTAIFQWGWLGSLINVEPAPIEPFVPMMMFAILFGLSMDYEVFLLSRVREEYLRSGDSRGSVADGLAATARVISAAAIIMVVVFGSFLGESDRIIKLFGIGLASAVALDATVVRMLLVPATMELLGDANWWLPKWLDRLIPRISVEGHTLPADPVLETD